MSMVNEQMNILKVSQKCVHGSVPKKKKKLGIKCASVVIMKVQKSHNWKRSCSVSPVRKWARNSQGLLIASTALILPIV